MTDIIFYDCLNSKGKNMHAIYMSALIKFILRKFNTDVEYIKNNWL